MKSRDKNRVDRDASTGRFVLGRERFEKISAVEGIARTPAMKEREKEFDRRGLTVEERRREIIRSYRALGISRKRGRAPTKQEIDELWGNE